MSELTEHFKVCDCHDSWDQCPCAEGGHPLNRECGCCGRGICGELPTLAARLAAARAEGARDMVNLALSHIDAAVAPVRDYEWEFRDPTAAEIHDALARLRALLADGGEPQ